MRRDIFRIKFFFSLFCIPFCFVAPLLIFIYVIKIDSWQLNLHGLLSLFRVNVES